MWFTALKAITDLVVGPSPLENRPTPRVRMYHGAQQDRTTSSFIAGGTSADTEIYSSLKALRQRSRALVRDNDYAKNAVRIIANNVIGCGIGMQAAVKKPRGQDDTTINDAIEMAWERWCEKDSCDVGGRLHFHDIERLAISTLVESGEVIIRKHYKALGNQSIPFALEILEPDLLADDILAHTHAATGNTVFMGIEIDSYRRPVAYHLRKSHPGDMYGTAAIRKTETERVPADQIIHLYIVDRPGQSRGVPWFHSAIRRLNNMGGYEEAEIIAARSSACIMGFVTSPEAPAADGAEEDGRRTMSMEPGIVEHLLPGEDFKLANPTRPNVQMDPFLRLMLRGVAAGVGVSYESISRDYSQSNYSSSRLALLDDRDTWKVLQQWFIRNVRVPLHREWLRAAVMKSVVGGIPADYDRNPLRYEAARFRPRGWSWVDPAKEVKAYREAIRGGFATLTDVIAQTSSGQDIEDVIKARAKELEMLEEHGIVTDTNPAFDLLAPAAEPDPGDTEDTNDNDPEDD